MKLILERLYEDETLKKDEACALLTKLTELAYNEAQMASLLTVLRMRDITVDELLGFREALLQKAHHVDLSDYDALDIVGTGGDGKNTFNISTCAIFLVAGASYNIAKHGNYAATGVSGASTVLQMHGVKFTNDEEQLRRSLDTCRVAYMHAPMFHPALGAVAPLRRNIGVKTFFNLLGPLVNPSGTAYQLLGVANLPQMRLYTNTLRKTGLGFNVVTSSDGYDEISLTGNFKIVGNNTESTYRPEDLGLKRATQGSLYGGDTPEEACRIFDSVLKNEATKEQTNAVVINAAVGINCVKPEKSLPECIDEARISLESGKALETFKKFIEING